MKEFDFSIDGIISMQLPPSDQKKINDWLMYDTSKVKKSLLDDLLKNPKKGKNLIQHFCFLIRKHVFITEKQVFLERWDKGSIVEIAALLKHGKDNIFLVDELNRSIREICDKAEGELFEAYQDQRIDPTNKYIKIVNPIEEFHSFLNSSDEVLLAAKLKELFGGKKGKDIAIMIIALEKLDKIRYTNRTKLYNSIRQKFGDIGADSGINEYLTPYKTKIATNRKPILTDADIQPFITKIKSLGC